MVQEMAQETVSGTGNLDGSGDMNSWKPCCIKTLDESGNHKRDKKPWIFKSFFNNLETFAEQLIPWIIVPHNIVNLKSSKNPCSSLDDSVKHERDKTHCKGQEVLFLLETSAESSE